MKKFLLILGILLAGNFVFANDQQLSGGVDFDWVNMAQVQRDEAIANYKNIMFDTENEKNNNYVKKDFRNTYKNFLKDKNFKLNYVLMQNNVTRTKNADLCAFFHKGLLYMYAIKYDATPERVYYYSGLGALKYVDEMSVNYPDYPYFSKQFRSSGKLAGAIYFVSRDLQYVYNAKGEFKGVWYKKNMYDAEGYLILTRSNW